MLRNRNDVVRNAHQEYMRTCAYVRWPTAKVWILLSALLKH